MLSAAQMNILKKLKHTNINTLVSNDYDEVVNFLDRHYKTLGMKYHNCHNETNFKNYEKVKKEFQSNKAVYLSRDG